MTDPTLAVNSPAITPEPTPAVPVEDVLGTPDVSAFPGATKVEALLTEASKLVTNNPAASGPVVSYDANGMPHLTLALTKKAKAHIGGVATLVTSSAAFAIGIEPDSYGTLKLITAGAIILGGAVLSWLGIAQATNLPKKV